MPGVWINPQEIVFFPVRVAKWSNAFVLGTILRVIFTTEFPSSFFERSTVNACRHSYVLSSKSLGHVLKPKGQQCFTVDSGGVGDVSGTDLNV